MGKEHQEGFTLVELFVVLMVASIALGIGIPATHEFVANSRMAGAVNDLVSSIYYARSQALALGVPVTICASTNQADCSDSAQLIDGWIVFQDRNGNGRRETATPEQLLSVHEAFAEDIVVNPKTGSSPAPPQYLFFAPDGSSPDLDVLGPATRYIQLCDERGARDMGNGLAAGRLLNVGPNGRPRLISVLAELQGAENPLGGC